MTAQATDILYYDGDSYSLHCEPLEDYFRQHPPRPEIKATCTACWRGYIATWCIKRSRLYLEKIEGFDREKLKLKEKLFPNEIGLVFASWFTGPLICPNGREREYVHMGYETTYDTYIIIGISNGKVQDVVDLSHDEFIAWRKNQHQ